MQIFKSLNLAVAFLIELAMLVAFAYWGFNANANLLAKILLGVGVPAIVIIIWGKWAAPKSERRLATPQLLSLKFGLFILAAIALQVSGKTTWAIWLFGIFMANIILAAIWKQL